MSACTGVVDFGNELDLYRTMAGAAHIFGRRFSSESGAAGGNNYLQNHGFFRQMFYLQYAAGIQKTIYHGYSAPYGPQGNVDWPGYEGMMPFFSERFQNRQPSSIDYPQVNLHLSRIQKAMEMGQPQIDLAILRTDYFVNNGMFDYALNPSENRTHQNLGYYWQDTTLQNMGYTYEYFSPHLLCDKQVRQENGILCPNTACYQAVIIMQEEFPLGAAKQLYEMAKGGLSVVFADHVEEIIAREGSGKIKCNTQAASSTGGFKPEEAELEEWIEKIKKLPNVKTAKSPEEVLSILKELHIYPRVAKKSSCRKLLTTLRKDKNVRYLYVYNYMYNETETVNETLEIAGKFDVYCLNTWSGEVELKDSVFNNKVTSWNVCLRPGAVAMFVLVENANEDFIQNISASEESGIEIKKETEKIELGNWHLKVDTYNPGELSQRVEYSSELGRNITEIMAETKHEWIDAGELQTLSPWKDIPGLGDRISGIGIYETTVELSETQAKGRITFCCDSLNLCTAAIWMNNVSAAFDMDSCEVDLTGLAREGINIVRVRVAGSLRNRLLQKGYPYWNGSPDAAKYGMTGKTCLRIEKE